MVRQSNKRIFGKSVTSFAVAIFLVMLFLLMFVSIPETASELEKRADYLGINFFGKNIDNLNVADAWVPPYSGGSYNFIDLDFNIQSPVSISSPAELTAPGSNFNKAVDYGSVKNVTNTATSWKADSTSTSAYSHHLWYRDYVFTDTMKSGLRNNLINSVTYTMNIDWSLGFGDDGGDVYQNMFIAFGSSSSTTPGLTTFTTLTSAVNGTGKVDVEEASNGTLDAARTVTLTKDGTSHLWPGSISGDTLYSTTTLVMRVGAFLFVQPNRSFWGAGVNWPTTDFQNPNGSALSMSWTQPKLAVNVSASNKYGAISGNATYINKATPVAVSNFNTLNATFTVATTAPITNDIYGYYFSGWTSPQTKRFSGSTLSFTIRGACDVPLGENTYTANFRQYSITGALPTYTYTQTGGGTSLGQGPSAPTANPILNDAAISGIRAFYSYTSSGGYNSQTKPADTGVYTLTVNIKDNGGSFYNNGAHTYLFEILPLDISHKTLSSIGTYTYDGTNKSYSAPGVRIAPSSFSFTHNAVTYIMNITTDYIIEDTGFGGEWTNATNAPSMQTDIDQKPHVSLNLTGTDTKKNFSGNIKAFAHINPLNINGMSVAADMDEEIEARYNTTYTGYEIKPEVIIVRLTFAGKEYKLIAHDYNNSLPERTQLYMDNYARYGEVGVFPALVQYTGGFIWASGYFAIQTTSYVDNVNSSTNTAKFQIKLVKGTPSDSESFNFVDNVGGVTNAVKYINFNIPKRDVTDTYDNASNKTDIISDYTQATYKPYIGPVVYNGAQKEPYVYYVLIKVTNAKLEALDGFGYPYWTEDEFGEGTGVAYYALTNSNNEIGDPTPPSSYWEDEWTEYPVVIAGTFLPTLTYTAQGKNNIDVLSGGVVNIETSSNSHLEGVFQLTFPISPKQLYTTDLNNAPGGGYILNVSDQTYNFGNSITPTFSAKATFDFSAEGLANDGEVVLISGADFTTVYSDNTDITQQATITITGKNNYTGEVSKTFNICALDITNNSNVVVQNLAAVTYTGTKFASTSAVITIDAGVNGTYNMTSLEYSVISSGANLNAGPGSFVLALSGYTAGTNGGLAGTGPRFAGQKTVSFTINPKNINSGNITKYASWSVYDPSLVTYDGNAKISLPIVTYGTVKTVVITDVDRSQALTYSTVSSNGDYMLSNGVLSWGTNPNAGVDTGRVTFKGIINYTGEVEVPFQILPKSITGLLNVTLFTGSGSGYNAEGNGYSFTGARIEPGVTTVEIERGGLGPLALSFPTDYTISYGSIDPQMNVYVKKGGMVTITGNGNYTATQVKTFNILAIAQTVTFVAPTISDSDVRVESITNVVGHTFYADYEINGDSLAGRDILVEARTTAIYPSARLIKFLTSPQSANITITSITYLSCVLEEIEGVTYSVTKAKVTVASDKRYGRVRIEAEQYDDETSAPAITIGATQFTNAGNYIRCEHPSANNLNSWMFFSKKFDSLDSAYTSINRTYGNNEFLVPRNKLASFLTTNPNIYSSISLTSSAPLIAAVEAVAPNWNLIFKAAGSCTVTLSHSGYVTGTLESNLVGYLAYSIDIPVTVYKRNLEISFAPSTTIYGTEATFSYTYRTWATDPAKGIDSYVGLTYKIISDNPSDIMTGMTINYSKDDLHRQSTAYIDNGVELHNPYMITITLGQSEIKADNYNITSAPGALTVNRKQLTASVSNTGEPNVMSKDYGTLNPDAENITYNGWIPGETLQDLLLQGIPFTPPVLQYTTTIGNPITQFTPIGTYTITLQGGTSKNYSIRQETVAFIIHPVEPTVLLPGISTTYRAATIGYPFNDLDLFGQPILKQAEIMPIAEGGTTPQPGSISYQYRFEEQPPTSDKPRRAGVYSTRVIYTAESGDNYKSVTKDFQNNIVIAKAVPIISLGLPEGETQYIRNFTGQNLDPDTLQPIISGVGTDRPVGGETTIKFRITGETEWVNDISAAGTYDLYIKFTASPTDNYTSVDNPDEPFIAALQIKDGVVDIVLQDGCRILVDFDGLNHAFNMEKVKFYGSPTDLDEFGFRKEIPGEYTLKYSRDGINWTIEAPINAGTYSISIDYETTPGYSYEGNTVSFNKYNGQDLFIIYRENVKDYMGVNMETAMQFTYDAEYHLIPSNLIILGKLLADPVGPTGSVSIGYQLSGNATAPVLARAKDVGTYDIVLQYTEGDNDNYIYTTPQRIQARLIINPAAVTISYASTYNVFDYTGDSQRVSVTMIGVKGETPRGTLLFEYSLNGLNQYTTVSPVNAGAYDIRVTYQRRLDIVDNYATTSSSRSNIIIINKISPILIINDMIIPFGTINAQFTPDVVLRGASRDLVGPPLENTDGTSTISYEYGINEGGTYQWYQWTYDSYPINSGKYSVRATYNPLPGTDSRNYLSVTAVRFSCLEIQNISPDFEMLRKEVFYTGDAVPAPSVSIINAGGVVPTGNISYEYKKQGTFIWRNSPPEEVGIYDIRVKYAENPRGDTFSSFTELFGGILEIKALPITIVPSLGQGNVFGSKSVASDEIIYSYYYTLNGIKHFVYPEVIDTRFGERIDVSSSEVLASDEFAYTLDMVDGIGYRDYSYTEIELLSGTFNYLTSTGDNILQNIDYTTLLPSGNLAEFTTSNKEYILDLENGVVRFKNYFENTILNYNRKNGYYFSTIDSNGKVENIEIIERMVSWLNAERTIGNYVVVRDGYSYTYTINLTDKKVIYGNRTYPMRTSTGFVSYSTDSGTTLKTLLIDENEVYNINLQNNTALYNAADGYVYEIYFTDEKAIRLYPVKIEDLQFSFETDDGNSFTIELNTDALSRRYTNHAGIYNYSHVQQYEDLGETKTYEILFVLDLNNLVALKDMRYNLVETNEGRYFEYMHSTGTYRKIYINPLDLVATDRINIYLYTDSIYQQSYYIDTANMIVRPVENRVAFNPGTSTISYQELGETINIPVDYHSLYFNSYYNNALARKVKLFGKEFDFTPPSLITSNSWSGNLRAQLGGAAGYTIEKGTIGAGTNYSVNISDYGVKYTVDKAPLYITFNTPSNNVYNGTAKNITYDVFGLIGNDNEEILSLIENLDGDNVGATIPQSRGYRLRLALNPNNPVASNYYLANHTSDYFKINPAVMETITFTPLQEGITYNGARHELKLSDIDTSYTIRYNGKETIPSFVNPGTYFVTAVVSKENYIPQTIMLSLTINKAFLSITPDPITRSLLYGDAIPSLTCESEFGTVRFTPGQSLHPAITEYEWEFVPFAQDFYDFYQGLPENNYLIKGKMNLNVGRAKPSLQVSGTLVQNENSPTAIQALINGANDPTKEISIIYRASDGTVYTSLPTEPGKYTVIVEYAGDDLYEETTIETTLTIKAKNNLLWLWVSGGAIIALALLSALFFLVRKQKVYA